MSTNISLADDVYDYLKEIKTKNNSSFSQVIRELRDKVNKEKGSFDAIMQLQGKYKDLDIDEKEMNSLREELDERL